MNPPRFEYRKAQESDSFAIMDLFHRAYAGSYPDPLMSDHIRLRQFLRNPNHYWFVTLLQPPESTSTPTIVASVSLRYDPENHLGKAFGAVVHEDFRRFGLMAELLHFGIQHLKNETKALDVVYATTRTIHLGAQALTDRLGFKKLGIFPNSHRTEEYETHCLTALYLDDALEKRNSDFRIHGELYPLLTIAKSEVPELGTLKPLNPSLPSKTFRPLPELEWIHAPNFIRHRFETLKKSHELQFAFFPFHEPNGLAVTADQSTEIFCYLNPHDGYAVIIGGKVSDQLNYTSVFDLACKLLRKQGARYVEILIRADKPKIIESILRAKFIPSAYFPAFQLHGGKRFDYVVMSRTFELFQFGDLMLQGVNQEYLNAYLAHWEKVALKPSPSIHPTP